MNPTKKQNLIYIGIALGVLILTIIFTQLNLGKYFRGFIATEIYVDPEITEIINATTGKPTNPPSLTPLITAVPDPTPTPSPTPDPSPTPTPTETISTPPVLTGIITAEDDNENDKPNNEKPSVSSAKLTNVDAFPKGFNPQLNATKISYSVTGKGKIDVKIHNLKGAVVATLAINQNVEKGEYHIWWDGTENNKSGKLVAPGSYTYKITLKDEKGDDVLDTASGNLNLVYAQLSSSDTEQPKTVNTIKATNLKSGTSNSQAVVSLQNATSGKTAGTGPETLIYLLFPLAGFILFRKKI